MRVFKNTWFTRFARKEGISDKELRDIAKQLEAGQADADLGGDVYKVRLSRSGEGKAGGYRVIVFFRSEDKTFFVYGFAKSDRDNIDEGDLKVYKKKAKKVFSFTDEEIRDQLKRRIYIEIL